MAFKLLEKKKVLTINSEQDSEDMVIFASTYCQMHF